LVALGPRARPKESRKRLPEIVPKAQRLHVTEVPNSFGSQVEHNLQNTVKIAFSSICRPKTSHSGVLLQSATHPQADQGGNRSGAVPELPIGTTSCKNNHLGHYLPPRAAVFVQMSAPSPPHPL